MVNGLKQNQRKELLYQYNSKSTMKEGIKFIITYSVLSVCLFSISKLFFKELTAEIFSYLLFYYIVTMSISIILFPLFCYLVIVRVHKTLLKTFLALVFCLIILSILPLVYDNRVILIDAIKGIFNHDKLAFNTLGILAIAIISFMVTYFLYRKDKLWLK